MHRDLGVYRFALTIRLRCKDAPNPESESETETERETTKAASDNAGDAAPADLRAGAEAVGGAREVAGGGGGDDGGIAGAADALGLRQGRWAAVTKAS
jgi:hypothetical protein